MKKSTILTPIDWWLEPEDDEIALQYDQRYYEEHYVAFPSIIFGIKPNPHHKLHLNCLVSPPLDESEKNAFKFEEKVLISIEK
jgi:hypothetical protein